METKSFSQLPPLPDSFGFLGGIGFDEEFLIKDEFLGGKPFFVSFAVNCPDFAATVTAFSCPLTFAG